MNEQTTDILIIGGGPAGSTTALYLSKLGFDIIIVEKKAFPRETLCGEFLSKEVTDVLKELNLFDDFITLKPNKLNLFKAVDQSGIKLESDLSFDAHSMKRSVFDSFLIEKAKAEDVAVIQPAEVISTIKSFSNFISEIEDGSGSKFKIKSRLVIAAYGKQNILDKKLERDFVNKKSNLNGVKFHLPNNLLKNPFANEIRIYTDEELYCGMNQVSDTEMTVCFLENRKQSKIPSRERLIDVIKSNKYFNEIFSDEAIDYIKSTNIYGTGNMYFGSREVVENGIIMVGDAARVISPLAGDGIGMAMESAKLLYEIISRYGIEDTNREKIYSAYKKRYEKTFKKRLSIAKIIQGIILNRKSRRLGFGLAKNYPALLPYLIKFTRSSKTA
ncbi:MAG: NAD(P)/FAD-dependent oxidoreductase [Ignavibacterium sp.]|jgi:flavin-dependent dehydrogenase|nr:NAD(P)/FAD-dependent oxidoreductase [Ignavibacterium sp.]